MTVQRRFAIAPAFVRLIRRERPAARIVEGHFADQPDRRSHVRLENERCELVLETLDGGAVAGVERAEVSRAQGEVLLDVCAGKVTYERIRVEAGDDLAVVVDRVLTPAPAQIARVSFPTPEAAQAFRPPAWLGPELKPDEGAEPRAVALGARPKPFDGPIPNAALDALIDLLDRGGARVAGRPAPTPPREDAVMSALKRLARGEGQPPGQPAPVPAGPTPALVQPAAVVQPAPTPPAHAPASAAESALFETPEPLRAPAGPLAAGGRAG